MIRNIDVNRAQELADKATRELEQASDYFTETVIGWEIVEDDYLTEFERDQLEFEGKIVYPVKELCV